MRFFGFGHKNGDSDKYDDSDNRHKKRDNRSDRQGDKRDRIDDRVNNTMKWRDFEKFCEDLIYKWFDENEWRIDFQRKRSYCDGQNKILDCHIAERRRGGNSFVVDFKHFPTSKLPIKEIQTTLDYKKRCRASRAVLMISSESSEWGSFRGYAQKHDVLIHNVNLESERGLFNSLKNFIKKDKGFVKELKCR
jgi:hypothetical protein